MTAAEIAKLDCTDLGRMSFEELRAVADADLTHRDGEAYQLKIHAGTFLDERFSDRLEAERQQHQEEEKSAKRERRVRKARAEGVTLPTWWFKTGAWAALKPAEGKGLVAIVSMVDPERNNAALTYDAIAKTAGISYSSARRAAAVAVEFGLVKAYTRRIPRSNPPRSARFYSISRTGAHR